MTSRNQRKTSLNQGYLGTGSLISNSGSSDSYSISSLENSQSKDQLYFDTTVADPFHQLLDDLNIIDDFIPDYNDLENEIEWHYGKHTVMIFIIARFDFVFIERQVADAARNVAQKQSTVFRLCQFEQEQFVDFEKFLMCYMEPLIRWINEPSNSIIFQRFPDTCSLQSLLELYEVIRILTRAHQEFFQGLKER